MTAQEARTIRDQALAATDYLMMPDYPLTPAGRMLVKYKAQEQISEQPNELTD